MKLDFFGKTVKAVRNTLTQPLNRRRQRGERLMEAPPIKQNVFMRQFARTQAALKRQSIQLRNRGRRFASGAAIRLPSVKNLAKRGDNAGENALCFAMAGQAVPFQLPPRFAGDEGILFVRLIREVVYDKQSNHGNQNYNYTSVTGWELWDYISKYKGSSKRAASHFASYSEEEVRLLSKDWLQVVATVRSLAKFLSDYASQNSPEHKAYLDMLGLNASNAHRWLEQVLEDRIFLSIHSYQIMKNGSLRITYMVPIPVGGQPSGVGAKLRSFFTRRKLKTIATDPTNFFKANLLCFKIVIEINFDQNSQSFDKGSGQLITGFLHHLPFRDDDIKTLQNPCNKHYFSFTSQGIQQYISTIGTKGMPMLKTVPLFRLLKNAVTPLAQKIEAKYTSTHKRTHKKGINAVTGLAQWIALGKPDSTEFGVLTGDPSYKNKMIQEFTPLMLKLIKRFNLYLNAVRNQL